MSVIAHGSNPSPEKIDPGRLETNPPAELEARATVRTAGMRGAVFADIEELVVMERDVPEHQNEVFLDPLALHASEGSGVGR